MTTNRTAKIAAGTTVIVPSFRQEAAARVIRQAFQVTFVTMIEGPAAGKVREYPTSMVRIPAAFETINAA